jgi:DNA-directed RNA polymerase specialized sigma24 family protein
MTVMDDRSFLVSMNDPGLAPYLTAPDDVRRGQELERILMTEVQPRARRVLAEYVRNAWPIDASDVDDTVAQVTLSVIRKLRAATVLEEESVQSIEAYVITLTRNLVRDTMRRRTPERTRLKSRLRYLFTHDPRLALWIHEGAMICGLAEWHGQLDRESDIGAIRRALSGSLASFDAAAATLSATFRRLRKPVRVGDLVSAAVAAESPSANAADVAVTPGDAVESRQYLQVLWREIRALPPRQQAALLLNLREPASGNALVLASPPTSASPGSRSSI